MKTIFKLLCIICFSPLYLMAMNEEELCTLNTEIKKYDNLAQLYLQRAQVYITTKDYKKASADLNKAIAIDSKLELSQLFLAEILIEEAHLKDAKALLDTLLSVTQNDDTKMQAFMLIGDIYTSTGQLNEASRFYNKIFSVKGTYKEVYYTKSADAYYENGAFKKSIKVLKNGLSTITKKDKLREKIVELSLKEGHFTLAMSVLNTMIKNDNSKVGLYYKRAEVFKEQGKIKEMERELKKAKLILLRAKIKNDNKTDLVA